MGRGMDRRELKDGQFDLLLHLYIYIYICVHLVNP